MGRDLWVVGRAICLYKLFFIPLDQGEQAEALSLQLRQWSPFADTGQYVVWQGDRAQVWIWDEERRGRLAARQGAVRALVVPEDLLIPPGKDDGIRLLNCLVGVESQYWRDGLLFDSHWWPQMPTEAELRRFFMANDIIPPVETPDCRAFVWLTKPWAATISHNGGIFHHYEGTLLTLLLAFALVALSWQGVSLMKWRGYERQLAGQVAQLTGKVEPILQARSQAYEQRDMVARMIALTPYPPQLLIWSEIVQQLSELKADILSWQYNNGRLELTIKGQEPDPSLFIRALAKNPLFTEVTATTDRAPDEVHMVMTVVKQADQSTAEAGK